jgi:hypothetical protein
MIKVGKSEFYAEIWEILMREDISLHEVITQDEFSCE